MRGEQMKSTWLCAILGLAMVSSGNFSVNGVNSRTSTAVATIEPRTGAAGYSWLRVYFYASTLSAEDSAAATRGHIRSIKQPWSAVLQLTLDASAHVWQIDLSLPGHTCTVAESDRDAALALSGFHFDGGHLRLRSQSSHVCDMPALRVPRQSFEWNVDLDVPVVAGAQ
jgi:hypothetical protein